MPKDGRSTENEIALTILAIAADQASEIATFHRIRKELPERMSLTDGDKKKSTTRHRERMWEQLIRNIKSHHESPGNFIYDGYLEHVPKSGYRITDKGRRHLKAHS